MSSGAGNGFTAKEHQKWYAAPPAVPFLTFFTRTTFPCPTGRTIFNGQQETDASAHKGTLLRKVFQSDKGWRKENKDLNAVFQLRTTFQDVVWQTPS